MNMNAGTIGYARIAKITGDANLFVTPLTAGRIRIGLKDILRKRLEIVAVWASCNRSQLIKNEFEVTPKPGEPGVVVVVLRDTSRSRWVSHIFSLDPQPGRQHYVQFDDRRTENQFPRGMIAEAKIIKPSDQPVLELITARGTYTTDCYDPFVAFVPWGEMLCGALAGTVSEETLRLTASNIKTAVKLARKNVSLRQRASRTVNQE